MSCHAQMARSGDARQECGLSSVAGSSRHGVAVEHAERMGSQRSKTSRGSGEKS